MHNIPSINMANSRSNTIIIMRRLQMLKDEKNKEKNFPKSSKKAQQEESIFKSVLLNTFFNYY